MVSHEAMQTRGIWSPSTERPFDEDIIYHDEALVIAKGLSQSIISIFNIVNILSCKLTLWHAKYFSDVCPIGHEWGLSVGDLIQSNLCCYRVDIQPVVLVFTFGISVVFKGDLLYHQVWVWLAVTFWKCAASDITDGRVHLDVWRTDEQGVLQSTG